MMICCTFVKRIKGVSYTRALIKELIPASISAGCTHSWEISFWQRSLFLNPQQAFLNEFRMQPPDMIQWLSPIDIPFPSFSLHLSCVACKCSWCWSNRSVLHHFSKLNNSSIYSMLEMAWTVQVNVKHLDFLRSINSERTLVFSQRSIVRMSVFNSSVVPSALAGAKFELHLEQRTLHDHSWEMMVTTLTVHS